MKAHDQIINSNKLMNNGDNEYGINTSLKFPSGFFFIRSSIVTYKQCASSQRKLEGIQQFWLFLISYLQIQHYNSKYIFGNQINQNKPSKQTIYHPAQPQSQDSVSVASSSVNIRQRKVSFGIIAPLKNTLANDGIQNRKRRRNQNIWVVPNSNNLNNKQISEQKIIRNQNYKNLIKRFKTMIYKKASQLDKLNINRSLFDGSNNQICPAYFSMKAVELLKELFPQQPFINSKVQFQLGYFLKLNLKSQSKLQKNYLSKSLTENNTDFTDFSVLSLLLFSLTKEILGEQKSFQTQSPLQKDQNKSQIASVHIFLKLFVRLFLKADQIQKLQETIFKSKQEKNGSFYSQIVEIIKYLKQKGFNFQLIHKNQSQKNEEKFDKSFSEIIGFRAMNGYFSSIQAGNGSFLSIDVEKIDDLPQLIKKSFKQSYRNLLTENMKVYQNKILLSKTKSQKTNGLIQSPPDLSKLTQISVQQPFSPPSPANLTNTVVLPVQTQPQIYFTNPFTSKTTQQAFISQYNHKYFKNQKLLYKQKQKIQQRFKEQDLTELIPTDNYNEGYQILINSKHSSKQQNLCNSNHNSNSGNNLNWQNQHNLNVINQENMANSITSLTNQLGGGFNVKLMEDSVGSSSFRFQRQNTGQFGMNNMNNSGNMMGFGTNLNRSGSNNNLNNNINRYSFYHDQQQQIQSQCLQQQQQSNQIDNLNSQNPYNSTNIITKQKLLVQIISRNDFQISDNQILDDIQRVLI